MKNFMIYVFFVGGGGDWGPEVGVCFLGPCLSRLTLKEAH